MMLCISCMEMPGYLLNRDSYGWKKTEKGFSFGRNVVEVAAKVGRVSKCSGKGKRRWFDYRSGITEDRVRGKYAQRARAHQFLLFPCTFSHSYLFFFKVQTSEAVNSLHHHFLLLFGNRTQFSTPLHQTQGYALCISILL